MTPTHNPNTSLNVAVILRTLSLMSYAPAVVGSLQLGAACRLQSSMEGSAFKCTGRHSQKPEYSTVKRNTQCVASDLTSPRDTASSVACAPHPACRHPLPTNGTGRVPIFPKLELRA